MNRYGASSAAAVIAALLVWGRKMSFLEAVLVGVVVIFIGWALTPFGKPFRQALEDWLYKPDAHTNQWLGIVHGVGKPWLQDDPQAEVFAGMFPIYGRLYTYRIGIINTGKSTIPNVEIKLTSIYECPPGFNGIGGHLHLMHDNPSGGQANRTITNIPPTKQSDNTDAVFIDVFVCFWPDKPEERRYAWLNVWSIVPRINRRIPLRKYQLTVTANDQEQAVVNRALLFEPQGDDPPTLKLQI